jgi:hypothetical protein
MIFTTYLPYLLQSLDQYNLQNHVKKPKICILCSKNHSTTWLNDYEKSLKRIISYKKPKIVIYKDK